MVNANLVPTTHRGPPLVRTKGGERAILGIFEALISTLTGKTFQIPITALQESGCEGNVDGS
jgi:hypothetical protein